MLTSQKQNYPSTKHQAEQTTTSISTPSPQRLFPGTAKYAPGLWVQEHKALEHVSIRNLRV